MTLTIPYLFRSVGILSDSSGISESYPTGRTYSNSIILDCSWWQHSTYCSGDPLRAEGQRVTLSISISRCGADSRAATPSSLKLPSRRSTSVTSWSPRWWSWSSPNLSLNYPFVTKYLQIKHLQRRNVGAQLHIYTRDGPILRIGPIQT